ncbi:WYL domain-containing protein [bacterium]|nr:WYL domain-containing protein [bacterium]
MKGHKKINDGCLKIFEFLRLLYEDKADYESVVNIFKDGSDDISVNNIQVNINKYINTLKVFGIKVKKINNEFKLLSGLYTLDLTLDDLKSVSILINSAEEFPEKNAKNKIVDFAKRIELRMNSNDKQAFSTLVKSSDYNFSFYYADLKQQIQICEEICAQNHMLHLYYLKKGKETLCKCSPKEVVYDSKNAYLKVYDNEEKQNIEIPISNILNIETLPAIARDVEAVTTVVYKVKNRLAKTYKLKEGEYTQGYDNDGNRIIVVKTDNLEKLVKRLMRYTTECEIISPRSFRDRMLKTINDAIGNYEV